MISNPRMGNFYWLVLDFVRNDCFACCYYNYFIFGIVWICNWTKQELKHSHTQRLDQLAHWRGDVCGTGH